MNYELKMLLLLASKKHYNKKGHAKSAPGHLLNILKKKKEKKLIFQR
jgi:hypothetical protein